MFDMEAADFSGQAFAQAPANDDFSNPQEITGLFGITSGTNVNATLETGEPTITAGFPGDRSVWFRWVAPASGSFTFELTIKINGYPYLSKKP